MWLQRNSRMILVVILLGLLSACQTRSVSQGRLALLTPEEAAGLRLTEDEWQAPSGVRGIPAGPRIVFQRPPARDAAGGLFIETVSPTDVVIFFEPNPAPVDMDSLQVEAKKWLFSTSLTSRLRPYIQGTSIQAKGVSIPEGQFVIQIEIADIAGARTVGTYRLLAKGQ